MRYRYYAHIHRYMRQFLSQFEAKLARADFSNPEHTQKLLVDFNEFETLLEQHAAHEDNAFHPLLAEKEPTLFNHMLSDHQALENKLTHLKKSLETICQGELNETQCHELGYALYLDFTVYLSEYFIHLYQEEKEVMPALQKHYSDDALRAITFNTYHQMTPEQITGMCQLLFPYVNRYERQVFLDDIHDACPDKFKVVFPDVLPQISDAQEREKLTQRYQL